MLASSLISIQGVSKRYGGVLALSNDEQSLAIDFSDAVWERGRAVAGASSVVIGRKDLTDIVFREAGFSLTGTPPNDIRPGMRWLWNDETSEIIDRIVFAT